jgi:hypothetical protein
MVILVVAYTVWSKVNDSGVFISDTHANNTMKETQTVLLAWDNLTLFIFLMLSAVTIVLASQIASHPAYFFISLTVLIIAVIVAVVASNAYEDLSASTELTAAAAKFPKTEFLLDKLPIYAILMMFAIALSIYAGFKLG